MAQGVYCMMWWSNNVMILDYKTEKYKQKKLTREYKQSLNNQLTVRGNHGLHCTTEIKLT